MVRREIYWITITDSEEVVEQELSYDAWGNRRDPETWQRFWYNPVYEEPMFDRGFTGHEHLYAFGLINMNGRVYDPLMSSFLSVDAFVQSPDNSQSFNRYSYCLNNPLKYTDPSGWVMQGGMNPSNPFHDNWGQNFGEKIYTSTEVRQMLWTTDISIGIWMVGNEMHGSRGGDAQNLNGGWIKNAFGISWNSNVSSQNDMIRKGIAGTFLGQTYIDEDSQTYYSLLGYTIDMTIHDGLAGKLAPLIDNAIKNLIQFEINEAAYNSWKSNTEPYQEYTDFGSVIDYNVAEGGVNHHDFDIGFAICHFSVYNNSTSMFARINHIDFEKNKDSNSGFGFVNWSDGYNIDFISKTNQNSSNPRNIKTLTITFTTESGWVSFQRRYKAVRGY